MVYRSDVEALQARLRSLDADLAGRQRERDEVARLLRDARSADAAVRWLEERPQRQRSRAVFVAIIAALIMMIGFVSYRTLHRTADPFNEVLRSMSSFTDKVCACSDAPCAQGVIDQMTRWSTQLARRADYTSRPTDAQIKQISDISSRLGACFQKVTVRPPFPSEQPLYR